MQMRARDYVEFALCDANGNTNAARFYILAGEVKENG